jgi:hypothetical protein
MQHVCSGPASLLLILNELKRVRGEKQIRGIGPLYYGKKKSASDLPSLPFHKVKGIILEGFKERSGISKIMLYNLYRYTA